MLLTQTATGNFSLERREKKLTLEQYRRGDEITLGEGKIWQVYRGVVELSRIQQDGHEIISGWVSANGVFGNFDDNFLLERAVALGDVYIRRYSLQDLTKYPTLAREFLAQFSDRLVKSQQLLAIIAISKVEDRLKHLLWLLQENMGHKVEGGVRLPVRFTHQHLAEAIHTTRVTITRILGSLQEQNLIYFDSDRHIVMTNI